MKPTHKYYIFFYLFNIVSLFIQIANRIDILMYPLDYLCLTFFCSVRSSKLRRIEKLTKQKSDLLPNLSEQQVKENIVEEMKNVLIQESIFYLPCFI